MTSTIGRLLGALAFSTVTLSVARATPPLVESFTGNVGVYAVRIDPDAATFTVLASDEFQPDMAFPLASSFKPVILYQVLQDIDAVALDWKTRIEIPESDQSLDSRIPRRSSVRRLAKQMITNSHNTSTDALFKQVGLDAPTQTLAAWGLSGMRIVMPTREFWLTLSGLLPSVFPAGALPTDAAAYAASTRTAQIATAELVRAGGAGVDIDALDVSLDDFYDFQAYDHVTTFDILDDIDNVATPREMVMFYWRLFFDNGLSADQDKQLRKIMKRGDRAIDKRQINVGLRYWGGKGGSDLGMGSAIGYGETRNENHILYAVMASHSTDEDADLDRIDQLITWIFVTLDAP